MERGEGSRPDVPTDAKSLMERVLDGDAGVPGDRARIVAALAAVLDDTDVAVSAELGGSPEESAALLAAFLDARLDENGRFDEGTLDRVRAVLSTSPAVFLDAMAAASFLDELGQRHEAVPDDLMRAVLARPAHVTTPRRRLRWAWPVFAVLAMATVALIVAVLGRPLETPKGHVPVAGTPVRSDAGSSMPAGAEQPAASGKARDTGSMPASSEEAVPVPRAGHRKPVPMQEETPDEVPARK